MSDPWRPHTFRTLPQKLRQFSRCVFARASLSPDLRLTRITLSFGNIAAPSHPPRHSPFSYPKILPAARYGAILGADSRYRFSSFAWSSFFFRETFDRNGEMRRLFGFAVNLIHPDFTTRRGVREVALCGR